jgi:hypothetical protein
MPIYYMSRTHKKFRNSSYAPTVNRNLVTLRSSRSRKSIVNCNNYKAFLLKEPIKVSVNDNCYPYNTPEAQKFLLDNLRANKRINVKKIITPIQSHANCWFNTMFTTFFISDKGRKFFHFFRQMMITGKRANGVPIHEKLWGSFALFNFAIECSLTGNKYAYKLNTNKIIHDLYIAISAHGDAPHHIVDVDIANNPIGYYKGIMSYLNVSDLEMVNVYARDSNWLKQVEDTVATYPRVPHIIVLEIMDGFSEDDAGYSGKIRNKEKEFMVGEYKYVLDSSVIRDIEQEHFCAMLTCDGKEMAYDGASFHRLLPMKWKENLNVDKKWKFKGTEHGPRDPLYWSFMHGYQILIYYRVA